MIDIHTHILPGIDDGPETWEISLVILRAGAEDGIRGAVCTSHVLDNLTSETESRILETFKELAVRVQQDGIPISLYLGSEIHIEAVFQRKSPIITFGGKGKFALVELPMGSIPQHVDRFFFDLMIDGVTPILAHPERNLSILRNPGRAYEWAQRGVLFQLNAGSLLGVFGADVRKTAHQMIELGWANFVASDCHDPKDRPMRLSSARRLTAKTWDESVAVALFEENPRRAVDGVPISRREPREIPKKRNPLARLFGG
jgi:protein-tyrosine phosphatase